MSHFYGTPQGNRGEATRCGSRSSGLTTIAASWSGAVRIDLHHDEQTGQDIADVSLIPWRGSGVSRSLYHGPVDAPTPSLDDSLGRVCAILSDPTTPPTPRIRAALATLNNGSAS